jgi:hypothetical protein
MLRGYLTKEVNMLPIPEDENYTIPELSDEDFFNLEGEEDEDLLKSGAWGPLDNDEEE